MYLNYMKVTHTLDQVVGEIPDETATADGIRNRHRQALRCRQRRLTRHQGHQDHPRQRCWQIEANYDDQAPLFANIFILVTFDKIVKLKGGGDE